MNDVRKMIYGAILGLFVFVGLMLGIVYVSSCGFTLSCNQAAPKVDRTPIPTLIPASHTETQMEEVVSKFNKCEISAGDLMGAWVSADSPESDPFPFSDVDGRPCAGTYAGDIQPLFVENSLWYTGAIGCVSCHNSELAERSAGLDLTSYNAMLLGSGRTEAGARGKDILGGGNWEQSVLYAFLVEKGFAPEGHSAESSSIDLIVFAGEVTEVQATPTP